MAGERWVHGQWAYRPHEARNIQTFSLWLAFLHTSIHTLIYVWFLLTLIAQCPSCPSEPDAVVVHVATNHLDSLDQRPWDIDAFAKEHVHLMKVVKNKFPTSLIVVSPLLNRRDHLHDWVKIVNNRLRQSWLCYVTFDKLNSCTINTFHIVVCLDITLFSIYEI